MIGFRLAINLINLELNEGVLGRENLFNLRHRTLRFTPGKGGYAVKNTALEWDSDFGSEQKEPEFNAA